MKPYIPIYNRPPNKLIRKEVSMFNDFENNLFAEITSAIFLDKNKKEKSMDIIVKWVEQ